MNHPDNYKEAYEEMLDLYKATVEKLHVCRNELCLRCGAYKTKHLGSCDECRWRNGV